MRTLLSKIIALALIAPCFVDVAFAGQPSFVIRCTRTSGPLSEPKYSTFYFFLQEGQVKGSTCNVPGNPCQIVSTRENGQIIVFQTPGENPDTLTIDLRTGAIRRVSHIGLQWTYVCRQMK